MSKQQSSEAVALGDGFDQPHEVSELNLVFGGDMSVLLPPYDSIPDEFKSHSNPWVQFSGDWFFKGVKKSRLTERTDVDSEAAWRHLAAIQGSWEPKHEHKSAGVAWLASRWFKAVSE